MSQITTHILDLSKGRPGDGIKVTLFQMAIDEWKKVAEGITNNDGRIPNLLKKEVLLESGAHKLRFETQAYFKQQSIETFYPFVEIIFEVLNDEHYHVPLLLSPYGYSTYRGS